ncbi:hypothetical protein L3Q67_43675 [Saccharothrix sp. AJ9571]|nr:hypothetical protein L3Q67_43675 [Saccharothrix sp. AJ9571]
MPRDVPKVPGAPEPVAPKPDTPRNPHAGWQHKHEAGMLQRPDGVPVPSDLAKAGKEIRGWVAAEKKPVREHERIVAANPDDRQHNYRVSYVVNYALKQAGAVPERQYTKAERAALSEKALWGLTALRQSDVRIGTSESLVLRDAQRYLYGSLGTEWLRKHVAHKYHVPPSVTPCVDGKLIDRGYEGIVKPGDIALNAAAEELTGRNPGFGRGKPGMPHSRPGGEAWYDRGLDRFGAATGKAAAPFILEVPKSAPKPEDSATRLAQPPGHVDLGHGESVNLETGRYSPGHGPKY